MELNKMLTIKRSDVKSAAVTTNKTRFCIRLVFGWKKCTGNMARKP